MSGSLTPENVRDEYYSQQAKTAIQAAVAARRQHKKILSNGLYWSLGLLVGLTALNINAGHGPYLPATLYYLFLVPFAVGLGCWHFTRERIAPEQAQEEARLAKIFAEEDKVRQLRYRARVLAEYRRPVPPA